MDRRNFLAMVMVSVASTACTSAVEKVTPEVETAAYAGPLPAGPIDPQPTGDPCPTCAYDTLSGKIDGKLKITTGFGSGHYPLQWMKAIYWNNGYPVSYEWISIGTGVPNTKIDHTVGETTFDEIYLEWKDAENIIGSTEDSIVFTY